MSTPVPDPHYTPNAIIHNPHVRKVSGNALAAATLLLAIAVLVDGAIDAFNLDAFLVPAGVIITGLFSIFQLGVTSPNVPKA